MIVSKPVPPHSSRLFETRSLHDLFGVEVRATDLANCGAELISEIDRLVGTAGLVLIRNAELDDAALAAFASKFGQLQNLAGGSGNAAGIFRVTNLNEDGSFRDAGDPARLRHEANKLWHTDSSFMSPGASYSFLYANIVPDHGKDTLFCDGRVAWDALDADLQRRLLPLAAVHSMAHSWRLVGVSMPGFTESDPVARKLVRKHEPSGRYTLVIPSHVERIVRYGYEEGQALLAELRQIAAAADRIYRHKWKVRDLLIWDNRCMLHRASRHGDPGRPRDLRTCRLIDLNDDGLATAAC